MTADRRRHGIETLPDGRLIDNDVMRWYLGQLDARAKRPTVARLSASDPMCVAVEATSRGVRAAA